jgi:hypothetical protein
VDQPSAGYAKASYQLQANRDLVGIAKVVISCSSNSARVSRLLAAD